MKPLRATVLLLALALGAGASAAERSAARLVVQGAPFGKSTVEFVERDCSAFWFSDALDRGRSAATYLRMQGMLNGHLAELKLLLPLHGKGVVDLGPGDRTGMTRYARLFVYGKDANSDVSATLGSLHVELTRFDAVGGRIVGAAKGTLSIDGERLRVELEFDVPRAPDVAKF